MYTVCAVVGVIFVFAATDCADMILNMSFGTVRLIVND